MEEVTVIGPHGRQTQKIVEDAVTFVQPSGGEISPSIVERLEYESDGEDSSITTVCGETENRPEEAAKPDIVAEGVITKEEMETFKRIRQSNVEMSSPLYTGEIYIKRLNIEMTSDRHELIMNGQRSDAFNFQMQLRSP